MSFYQMVNGVNQAVFFVLPMLSEKHPDNYPRFRDCIVYQAESGYEIDLLTRVGGGNRGDYTDQINELQSHKNYLRDFDDESDSTYAHFMFSIPEEFKADFDKIIIGDYFHVSKEYQERVKTVFPKLAEKLTKAFSEQEKKHE